MNRSFRLSGWFAAAVFSVCSSSATTITESFTAGLVTSQAGATTIDFNNVSGSSQPVTLFGITFSSLPIETVSLSGNYAQPPGDSTPYLTVGSPGLAKIVTITSSSPLSYYGFYLGSPDSYNSIDIYAGAAENTLLLHVSGFFPESGDWAVGEYVNFTAATGTTFSEIVMSSTTPAMETDNHAFVTATNTPEPATLGLLGTALAALALYRRRRA